MADHQVPRMFALQHQFAHGTLPLSKGRLLTSDNLEHLFPQASRKPQVLLRQHGRRRGGGGGHGGHGGRRGLSSSLDIGRKRGRKRRRREHPVDLSATAGPASGPAMPPPVPLEFLAEQKEASPGHERQRSFVASLVMGPLSQTTPLDMLRNLPPRHDLLQSPAEMEERWAEITAKSQAILEATQAAADGGSEYDDYSDGEEGYDDDGADAEGGDGGGDVADGADAEGGPDGAGGEQKVAAKKKKKRKKRRKKKRKTGDGGNNADDNNPLYEGKTEEEIIVLKAEKKLEEERERAELAASLGMTLEQMDALDSVEEAAQGMEDEYLEAFQKFDADGSGDVSPEELKQVLMNTEEGITDEELDKLVAEADVDGDGTISYEEFVRMMKARKTIAALASTLTASKGVGGSSRFGGSMGGFGGTSVLPSGTLAAMPPLQIPKRRQARRNLRQFDYKSRPTPHCLKPGARANADELRR